MPAIEGKLVNAFAVFTRDRVPMLPNLPTAHEQGFTAFDASTWFAFFLPRGTPAAIVQRLHAATVAAMETRFVQDQLLASGTLVVPPERRSTAYLKGFVASEIERNAAPIKAAGLALE